MDKNLNNYTKKFQAEITRSDATWMSQFEMILNDKAILISIRDPGNHKMVGLKLLFNTAPAEASIQSALTRVEAF